MHHSARKKQQFISEKATAFFFNFVDGDEYDDDEYDDHLEEELTIVKPSLCERKMNLTLHPGQMCAGGEEDREHCQVELETSQMVLQINRFCHDKLLDWVVGWVSGSWPNINSFF